MSYRAHAVRLPVDAVGIAVLVLVQLAAGLHRLGDRSFWHDEAWSATAVASLASLEQWHEPLQGLYYVLLFAWALLGRDEVVLRSLSVLLAAAAVIAVYLLARRIAGSPAALIAGALLVANGFFLGYAREARMYALVVLLVTLSSLALLHALATRRARWIAAYGLTAALAIYAHFFAVFVVLAQFLVVLAGRRLDRWFVAAYGGVAIAVVLLIGASLPVQGRLDWIDPIRSVVHVVNVVSSLTGLQRPGAAILFGLWLALAAGGAWVLYSRESRDARLGLGLAATWLAIALVAPIALSLVRPMLVARYFIVVLPPLLVLASVALAAIPVRSLRVAAVAALLLVSASGAIQVYERPFPDWRALGAHVTGQARAADRVLLHPEFERMTYRYYASRGDSPRGPNPTGLPDPDALASVVREISSGGYRLWTVAATDWRPRGGPLERFEGALLAEGYRVAAERSFGTLVMRLLVPGDPP